MLYSQEKTMVDFKKFYNSWFYNHTMELIHLDDANKEQASNFDFTVEYNFDDIPDLPLADLAEYLLRDLPKNFVFVNCQGTILSPAIEHVCHQIGRSDIKFINPYTDIDAKWFDQFKEKIFFYESQTLHEIYTLWSLAEQGISCGYVGYFVQFTDFGIAKKNTTILSAGEPNWQAGTFIYNNAFWQLAKFSNQNLVYPNFTSLLIKSYVKQVEFEKNWINYRMHQTNKMGPTTLAISLAPFLNHNFKLLNDVPNYPRYPGLISRDIVVSLMPALNLVQ